MKRPPFLAIRTSRIGILSGLLLLTMNVSAQRNIDDAVVLAPIDGGERAEEWTRTALEDSIRRFADRFYSTVTQTTNLIRNAEGQDAQTRLIMQDWKSVSAQTIVELAIGQNAVTSLLDMMVLTRLSRLMVDEYWARDRLAPDDGRAMSEAYTMLEADIWSIGSSVLPADQNEALRDLIDDWYRDNPDQIYPWYIRLDEFSDQRAVALRQMEQRGGLLGIREARESIEEIQAFGERTLYYLQRAPTLMSYEMESSIYEVLAAEEIASLIGNADDFAASVEEMVQVIADIPGERIAAIDQLMEQLSAERVSFMQDLRNTSPEAESALEEVRLALEAFERVLLVLGVDAEKVENPDARTFDITEYQALAAEAGTAAAKATELIMAIESLVSAPDWSERSAQADALLDRVAEIEERIITRLFLAGALLIVIFFAGLVLYRLLLLRVFRVSQR